MTTRRTASARPPADHGEAPGGDGLVGFYAWTGQCYRVPGDRERLIVGREGGDAARLDIALADSQVSSMHCIIERKPGGQLEVHDCSKNGTFVNGALVRKTSVGFRSGDTLMVGETKLAVLRESGPDFGPGPHADEVILAAFRYHQTLRATAEALDGISFHRVRAVVMAARGQRDG